MNKFVIWFVIWFVIMIQESVCEMSFNHCMGYWSQTPAWYQNCIGAEKTFQVIV